MDGLLKSLNDNESSVFSFKQVRQRTVMYLKVVPNEEQNYIEEIDSDGALVSVKVTKLVFLGSLLYFENYSSFVFFLCQCFAKFFIISVNFAKFVKLRLFSLLLPTFHTRSRTVINR